MTGRITRRRLLIGGGVGAGLVVGWALWPRHYAPNLAAVPGQTIFGPFLRIGEDWRTVAVEPAPVGPLYANGAVAEMLAPDVLPFGLRAVGAMRADAWARADDFAITGLSTSVRAFEPPLRAAGAAARVLLCMAAAERLDADWRACDTAAGFVVRGKDRLRFADLAARAARLTPPSAPPLREPGAGGLSGRPLPRLDAPAKLDGSARFAADVRLPGMVFAALRQAPAPDGRLTGFDKAAARRLPDLVAVIDNPGWVAAVADNWWAANRALDALAPRFATAGGLPDSGSIDAALTAALAGAGSRVAGRGSPDDLLGADALTADYGAGLAAHAALETAAATARIDGDRLELWIGTQAPGAARAAAARAIGVQEADVVVYPMPLGGGFGAGLDMRVAEQAAILARRLGRPVQLMAARGEDGARDRCRPPARARLRGALAPGGGILAWHARLAAPAALRETIGRLFPELPTGRGAEPLAAEGLLPPYAIPATAVDHHPVDIVLPTGVLRGEAAGYATFFAESFVDELAARAGVDPLSFRIDMLGDEPRLAACLLGATALGGWQGGGQGTAQGIAAFAGYGSYIAMMAQVHVGADRRIVVDRIAAAVDCGRMINPDLVRQQIEGGILFALPAAIGPALTVTAGLADRRDLAALGLPRLADSPEIRVALIAGKADPGGVSGLAVPPVAPAIANALAAATGHRSRTLPLSVPA
ncbi:MAG TPA: molybdopterin cofactor-binding domain-containing protein [Sphingomonas sp.]